MRSFSRLPRAPPRTLTETLFKEMYLIKLEPSTCGMNLFAAFCEGSASSLLKESSNAAPLIEPSKNSQTLSFLTISLSSFLSLTFLSSLRSSERVGSSSAS